MRSANLPCACTAAPSFVTTHAARAQQSRSYTHTSVVGADQCHTYATRFRFSMFHVEIFVLEHGSGTMRLNGDSSVRTRSYGHRVTSGNK